MKIALTGAALAALLCSPAARAQDKAPERPQMLMPPKAVVVPLKVRVVLSKLKGETVTATLPYTLPCNADDRLRRAVIQQLICHFELDFAEIEQAHDVVFRDYFGALWPELRQMARDGLISLDEQRIEVLPAGRLLVRSLCMLFDRYLNEHTRQRFSRVI